MLLGILTGRYTTFRLRGSHLSGRPFKTVHLCLYYHPTAPAETEWEVPQPRPCNARRLSHMERFSLIRVRSPLLTESLLFSLPAGTEMFHFPRSLHAPYVFRCGSPGNRAPGGVSPFGHPGITVRLSTPRLIADSYVLLRLLMPRHPPCAFKNLTTKDQKTIFERTMKTNTTHPKGAQVRSRFIFLEIASYKRCSRPLCSSQTTTPYHTPHTPPPKKESNRGSVQPGNQKHKSHTPHPTPKGETQTMVLLSQDPTVCQTLNRPFPRRTVPGHRPSKEETGSVLGAAENQRPLFVDIPPVSTRRRTSVCATGVLLTTPPHPHNAGQGGCRCSLERR